MARKNKSRKSSTASSSTDEVTKPAQGCCSSFMYYFKMYMVMWLIMYVANGIPWHSRNPKRIILETICNALVTPAMALQWSWPRYFHLPDSLLGDEEVGRHDFIGYEEIDKNDPNMVEKVKSAMADQDRIIVVRGFADGTPLMKWKEFKYAR